MFRSYVLPLLLTILLIVASVLLGLLKLTNVVLAGFLFAIIGLGVFSAELLISKSIRNEEKQNAYAFITNMLVRERSQSASTILTLDEVVAIEAAADEVWIYAYDLEWEGEDSPLPDLVNANLLRGVKYRYIVPNTKNALIRIEHLQHKYATAAGLRSISFRIRQREQKLVQFGIAIYNPFVLTDSRRPVGESVVVFFPHYQLFGPKGDSLFITLRGRPTTEVQEGFCELWNDADEVDYRSPGRIGSRE